MVNLSQPMSFQTAAMAALEAVESRSVSRANSTQQQPNDTTEILKDSGKTRVGSKSANADDKEDETLDDDYALDIDGAH